MNGGLTWRWVTFYGTILGTAALTAILAPTGVGLPVAMGILSVAPVVRAVVSFREGQRVVDRRGPDGQVHDPEDPPR